MTGTAGTTTAGGSPGAAHAPSALTALRQPATIRARCQAVLRAAEAGRGLHFGIDRSRLDDAAARVAALTLARFPDLRIPYHSRWRHFEAGGVDRPAELAARLAGRDADTAARARFDVTVVSVLLDAGAGAAWRHTEPGSGLVLQRSEGLGVASWHAFMAGAFSATPGDALRADAPALERVDAALLQRIFQAGPDNAMVGLDGRAGLLARLGAALRAAAPDVAHARPALLYDRLVIDGDGRRRSTVAAADVLRQVLEVLGPIWTSGSTVGGVLAGDVWPHPHAGDATGHAQADDGAADTAASGAAPARDPASAGWVPFHKLSQWLSYSLLEPLQWAGVTVTGLDALTGLPEYRNGGLLLDTGVIVPLRPEALAETYTPGDPLIVEWRALTVALLDELAGRVRDRLGVDAERLPLACVLEGGTWAAGRQIAAERRPGGTPPLAIRSDGTIF
jgi:hypothetical protein